MRDRHTTERLGVNAVEKAFLEMAGYFGNGAIAGSPLPDLMIGLGKGRSLQVSSGIDPDRLRRLIRSIEQA